MSRMNDAGRRLQDWTNKHVFVSSFESNDLPAHSYQLDIAPIQTPNEDQKEVAAEDEKNEHADPHAPDGKPITALQAAWNVTNAIQGMFIVGLPFAVKVGGWVTVIALVGVSYVCYRTGLSLIECLYEDGKKVRHSYREVAEAVRPGLGKLVLFAQLTELASTCILYLVLAGDLLQGAMPSIDKQAWMMLVAAALLGTALIDDIRLVSHLSLANAVSHLVINAIMVLYCLSQLTSWQFRTITFFPSIRLLPTMIGVVVFGYTSHIFLPSLEASMENPKEFRWMLSQSHIAAAVFKAVFGLIGFLTFSEYTQKEISNSLPNQFFKVIINLVLVVKALLSYPLPFYAIVQLLTENFFRGVSVTVFSSCYGTDKNLREWALCLRIVLLLWTLLVALSVPYLIEFMGLIGNITGTMLSFIWPAYFHLKLRGGKLKPEEVRFNKIVIGMGLGICVIGVYYSVIELVNAIQYEEA
ncbi:Vesicular GABA transporter [Aphelenchoides besseyi]|nr:Vesicular GABA transporter [Aphelenchoides besseyi]